MSNYNLNQPSLPEIREKIEIARQARAYGKKLRQGKSLGFRPQVGVHPSTAAGFRPSVARPGSW